MALVVNDADTMRISVEIDYQFAQWLRGCILLVDCPGQSLSLSKLQLHWHGLHVPHEVVPLVDIDALAIRRLCQRHGPLLVVRPRCQRHRPLLSEGPV